jgi:hypothetical protein
MYHSGVLLQKSFSDLNFNFNVPRKRRNHHASVYSNTAQMVDPQPLELYCNPERHDAHPAWELTKKDLGLPA